MGQEALTTKADDWPPEDITKAQLISELGKPNSSTVSIVEGKTTEKLTWVYARAESNPALFIPVVGLFVAASGNGMSVNSRSLEVAFDTDEKLTSRTWSQMQTGNAQDVTPEEKERQRESLIRRK